MSFIPFISADLHLGQADYKEILYLIKWDIPINGLEGYIIIALCKCQASFRALLNCHLLSHEMSVMAIKKIASMKTGNGESLCDWQNDLMCTIIKDLISICMFFLVYYLEKIT